MGVVLEIDEQLLAEAMALTGLSSSSATVEEALQRLVRREHQLAGLSAMAELGWEGDLDTMREGHPLGS